MPNLPEKKVAAWVDPWETAQDTWQYVTIPDEDPTGTKFAPIRLNKHEFLAGQTYKVPPPVAQYVNERVKVYTRSVTRLFNGKADLEALRVVPVGSAPSGDRPSYIDATKVTTA